MKKAAIGVATLLLIWACSGIHIGARSIPDGPVQFNVILSGSQSQVDSFRVELVTQKDKWRKIWVMAKGKEDPLPAMPTVDFSRQYIIAAFMGQRNTSGYQIEISAIEKKGHVLRVHVKKHETPGMLPVITNPFTLVRIPRGGYKLEIIEEIIR